MTPLIAVWLALVPAARAGFTSADIGASSAQFLKLGAGARAEGLGEAYTAVVDEASAIYWNPAALPRVERSATFAHSALLADISYEFLGYGQKLGYGFGVGGSVQYLSQPGLSQTDSAGYDTGATFRPSDLAVAAGLGYEVQAEGPLQGSSFGAAAKYVRSTITRSASTVAADLGFLSPAFHPFGRELHVAYVAQNLGGTLKFQQSADPLPITLRLGSSYALLPAWTLSMDMVEPLDNYPFFSAGTEYRHAVSEDLSFAGRFGINTRSWGEVNHLNGVNFGLGARSGRWSIDYALATLGTLGATHRVSAGVSF